MDKPGNKPVEKPVIPDKPATKPDDKTVVDKDGNVIVDKNGNIVDKDGTIVVDKDGNTLDKEGNVVVDKEGNILDKEGNVIVDKDGNLVDKDGGSVDAEGNIVDKNGDIVVDKDGNVVDKDGTVVVDKDNNIVDKNGNVVIDKDNNIVDDSGNVVVDKGDSPIVSKPEVPKGDNLPTPQPPVNDNTQNGGNTNPPKPPVPPVPQVTYVGLTVKIMPDKVIYKQGDLFDKKGLVLEAQYSDKTKKEVKDFTVPTLTKLMPSDTGIEVSYADKGTTFKVRVGFIVEKRIAIEIEVTKDDKIFKSDYIEGEKFSPNGLKVKITYDNRDVEEQIKTESQIVKDDIFVWSSADIDYGQKIVEIWDKDKTIAQNVDITTTYKVPQSIEIFGAFKKDYIEEEVFDTTGLKALVKFNNGTEVYVDDYVYSIAELHVGTTELDIDYTYQGVKVTTKITGIHVSKMSPVKLQITKAPDKTAYKENTPFDTAGMLVDTVYDNKKTYAVSDLSSLVITPASFKLGDTKAVISYTENGKTVKAEQVITVVEKELTGITIKTPPTKVDYIEEQKFVSDGLELTLAFDNGSTENVTTGYTFAPTTGLIKGTTEVEISYSYKGGIKQMVTQPITVAEKKLTGIAFKTESIRKAYIEGQKLEVSPVEVTANWDNGIPTTLINSDLSWEVNDNSVYKSIAIGDTVLVDYTAVRARYLTENTEDILVSVGKKKPTSLKVTQVNTSHEYIQGQVIKPEEFKVEATFDNGTITEIKSVSTDLPETQSLNKLGNYSYSPKSKLTRGENTITFSYSLNGSTVLEDSIKITARARKLTGITVKAEPTKKNYIEEQKFNPDGLVLSATFDSSEVEDVTTGYTFAPVTGLIKGTTSVDISYVYEDGSPQKTTQAITVVEKKLTGITFKTETLKKNYIEGQKFKISPVEVTANWDNGIPTVLTNTDLSWEVKSNNIYKQIAADDVVLVDYTAVRAKYLDKNTEDIIVSVVIKKPVSIKVTQVDATHEYIQGQLIKPEEFKVEATFDNGTSAEIKSVSTDLSETPSLARLGNYTYSPSSKLTIGENVITFSYSLNGSTTVEQRVSLAARARKLTGIVAKTPPTKVNYIEEQKFDKTGLVLIATFDSGETEDVTTGYTFSPTIGLVKGTTKIDISYTYEGGTPQTTTQAITVAEKKLTEIIFKTEPTTKNYIEGHSFVTNEAEVTANWDNDIPTTLQMSDLSWEVKNGLNYSAITIVDKMLIDYTAVRAKYLDKTTEDVPITVVTKKPTSIKVTQVDSKHEYIQGQTVKPEEFKVEATFDNGTTKVIPVVSADIATTPSLDKFGNYTYAPMSKLVTGNNTVTFSYSLNGSAVRTDSLTLSARARKLVSIKVKTPPTDINYIEGQTFDNKGTEIAAVYDSEEEELLKTNDYIYQIPAMLHVEDTQVAYSYTADGVTCITNQPITVVAKKLVSVELSGTYKTSYIEGQTFDNSGLIVTATFDNGMGLVVPKTTDASVVDSIYVVGNYNLDTTTKFKLGDTSIPVTYVYKSQTPITKQIAVSVVAKKPVSISITNPPTKVSYVEEESFNQSGMVVTATYDNGEMLPVIGYSYSPSGQLSQADKQVTVSYSLNGATVTAIQAIIVDSKYAKWFTFDSSTGTITKYSKDASAPTNVIVPEYIGGVKVTTIYGFAFHGCSSLISITLPDSVLSIGGGTFQGCSNLTSIILSNSMTMICDGAFQGCSSLASINLPNSITKIGSMAFMGCTSLTGVVIPDSVAIIGDYTFNGCTSLTSINIPNQVTTIGDHAFFECTNLTSIVIPDLVTTIGANSFQHCTNLTTITLSKSLIEIGNSAFDYCTKLTSIILPNTVTTIGYNAFFYCSGLRSATLSDSLIKIGAAAFSGCSNLEQVDMRNKVTVIEFDAFKGCTKLSGISLSTSLVTLGAAAFQDCTSLSRVVLPDSVTSVDFNAFCGCTNLAEVTLSNSLLKINAATFSKCTSLVRVVIPNKVTAIEFDAFKGCTKLNSVTLSTSLTTIGAAVFQDCISLTEMAIPDTVITMDFSVFYECTGLTKVVLSNSLTGISASAFYGCTSLQNIVVPNKVVSIGNQAFQGCSKMTNIGLSNSLNSIGEYAFFGCTSLREIILPNTLKNIGHYAFFNCTAFTTLTIPQNVESIGISILCNCSNLGRITSNATGFDVVEGRYLIDNKTNGLIAFAPSGVTTANIPSRVTGIGTSALYGCMTLTKVTLPTVLKIIDANALAICTGLTSITIPNSVATIGELAFDYCSSLTRININKPQNSISGAPWGAPSATVYWQGQFSKNKLPSQADTYIDSPKNEEHKDCITCQGIGVQQERCSLCLGTGKYTQEKCALGDKCDVCKHQTDVCPQCQGTGKGLIVKCKDCQGTGKQPLKLGR